MTRKEFVRVFQTWLKFAEAGNQPGHDIASNMASSALLYRMLDEGKDPVPYHPPRARSMPWYEVCDSYGPHQTGTVGMMPDRGICLIKGHVWQIVARLDEDEFLVTTSYEDRNDKTPIWVLNIDKNTIRQQEPISWIRP